MKSWRYALVSLLFPLEITAAAFFLMYSCSLNPGIRNTVSSDLDFDKFSLILTEAEKEVYKHLPEGERQDFLELCWKFRDPDPTTEENELREEFKERVAYANRWFSPIPGDRLSHGPQAQIRDAGWFTERGKVYIILGPPDRMFFLLSDGDFHMLEQDQLNERWRYDSASEESWDYDRYKMAAYFYQAQGRWSAEYTPELIDTIAEVKDDYLNASLSPRLSLRFEVKFGHNHLILKIPVNKINFTNEGNGLLKANFRAVVTPYRGAEKLEEQTFSQEFKINKADKREKRDLLMEIPFQLPSPGAYLLDVILEDITGGEVVGLCRALGSAIVKKS
ncbi:MAG: GWxTD domain-containing protein [Candidatus Saccharicenans sp.]|nr:MAG: hypothetical protein C0168_10545 [Candidatus Aminicenantes bacterium]HEK85563.1 GWxTD domain-containing protein [Candidatus Aminicenantes bacterium]